MKFSLVGFILLIPACDHIDAVGDKVGELKVMRQVSTGGIQGDQPDKVVARPEFSGPVVQDLSESEFQSFISQPGRINIVDFYANWCPPCRRLAPVITDVVTGKSNVARLGKINVDQADQLPQALGVTGIPDVRFYIDGVMVDKFVGGRSERKIIEMIDTHTASITTGESTSAGMETLRYRHPPAKAKPLEEAMKPMTKDWLPPGMSQK